ncbi:GNAT family N-acetyltransferase [Spirillospora albida]|uniref:GNAT family N-acetyltransferase n=1 Tax=Spirillospora albida TaxID=58123 RepID=UPI00068B8494|nr:GNAT family N-acetyltransferase [Spirillospora albida]
MTTATTAFLIQPTDDTALRASFLDAMAEHERVDGGPDADGLTMADLTGRTCITHYTEGLRDGTALRPGTEPMKQTVWWFVRDDADRRTYLGRISLRHHPVTSALGEPGSQLWITVRPTMRRKGLGRALLTAALPFARANGITQAVVEVSHGNAAARRLLQAAGATPVEHRPAERAGRRRYHLPTG